jgi:hypothetical protein
VRTDAAAIEVTTSGLVPRGTYGYEGGFRPTRSAVTTKIGETICTSLANSDLVTCGKVVARSVDWRNEGIGRGGYWVTFESPPQQGDSGSPVYTVDGHGIGLVTAGRPIGSLTETLVEPLLHPPKMGPAYVPGILDNPYLGHLSLTLAQPFEH